jgi:uncharacterized protein (DUF488 family)
MEKTIWTVGHSTTSIERFIEILKRHSVTAVADVRSSPYSARMPWFSERQIGPELKKAEIEYLWIGDQLGGRPADPNHYDDEGHALYGLMAEATAFEMGIERIESAAGSYNLALMCSEEDPVDCHRNTLIGTVLRQRGKVQLKHILHKEVVAESDSHLLQRLTRSQRHLATDPLFSEYRPVWRSTHSLRKPWPTESEEGE